MDDRSDPYQRLMYAARRCVAEDKIDQASNFFEAALDVVRRVDHKLGIVTTLIEYGTALAIRGRGEQGAQQVYEAELLALEYGFSTDTGLFALTHAKIWSARGEHAMAAEHFRRAAEEFRAIQHEEEAAFALSRRANEIEDLGDSDAAIEAHTEVVAVLRSLPGSAGQLRGFEGLHLQSIAALHRQANRPIPAQQALYEARDSWCVLDDSLAAARCDLSIGDIYVQLECETLALPLYQSALAVADAFGNSEIAEGAAVRIAALREQGHDAGPTLA